MKYDVGVSNNGSGTSGQSDGNIGSPESVEYDISLTVKRTSAYRWCDGESVPSTIITGASNRQCACKVARHSRTISR